MINNLCFSKIKNMGTHIEIKDSPEFIWGWRGWGVSLHIGRPPDAQTAPGHVKDRASKQPELSPIWAQLKSQSPDGKHPQQIFANTKSHIIRTGTANTPPLHQTALSYETAAPDGGRLAPKNAPRERESPPFSLRRSPRTT